MKTDDVALHPSEILYGETGERNMALDTEIVKDAGVKPHRNTRFSYLYRDAYNYKTSEEMILQGPATDADLNAIKTKLEEGDSFIPEQVNLPGLQANLQAYDADYELDEDGTNPADHPWHEIDIDDIRETDEAPTTALTLHDIAEKFSAVKAWDEAFAGA